MCVVNVLVFYYYMELRRSWYLVHTNQCLKVYVFPKENYVSGAYNVLITKYVVMSTLVLHNNIRALVIESQLAFIRESV